MDDDPPPGSRQGPPSSAEPTPTQPLPPGQQGATGGGAGARPRFTDRVWRFPVLVAVALVALLVGGLLGAGLANVADPDRPFDSRYDRFERRDHMGPPGSRRYRWREPRYDRRGPGHDWRGPGYDRRGPWGPDGFPGIIPSPAPVPSPSPTR